MTLVPVLETERLIMREVKPSDFKPFAAFFTDEVSRFLGGPIDAIKAWRKLSLYAGQWSLNGFGEWALETKSTGEFAGICGPWFPLGWNEKEISWVLMPGHYGKGYATEAARRALQFAYQDLKWKTAISQIEPENVASIRVAERLGAKYENDFSDDDWSGRVYRHLPPAEHAKVCNYDL